jgi:hypothetical protein
MLIKFSFKLRCRPRGKNFSIVVGKTSHTIRENCDLELDVEHNYSNQDNLKLFSLVGLTAGLDQQITVMDIKRNNIFFENFFSFCEFQMKNNLYVESKTLAPCWELCFNGDFVLNINFDRRQFESSTQYRSKSREDFVYNNDLLGCNAPHNCYPAGCGGVDTSHRSLFLNRPYALKYHAGYSYDYGCFGCSVTAGSGLMRGQEWPSLLGGENYSVINLALGGLGPDGIFLNLRSALREFNLGAVIVLWPNLERQCLRWRVDDWHLRLPVTVTSPASCMQGIWDTPRYQALFLRFLGSCASGRIAVRGRRIISRAVAFLKNHDIPAWHSSWCPDTYYHLQSLDLGSALLPLFPKNDRGALDKWHPSSHQQRSWYESIKKQVSGINGKA